ncbi:hypothetical protein PMAYCL1PPCAC_14830, partial [Pristionchus mayeri]
TSTFAQSHEAMAFLNRIFHGHDYDQTPPVHIIYPSREAYQIPIDYTGTGSSQWGHPQQQQQPWQGFPMGQQQQMQQGMGGPMQQMQHQDGGMMQQGGFPGPQMGFGGHPGMMQQGGFPGQQQMPMGFGAGPMMGGQQHQQQQNSGCPIHHHQGMPGGMPGEPHRMIIPGQHGVLVIEGPSEGFQQGGPQHLSMHQGQTGRF